MDVGELLRAARERAGFNQRVLALRAGTTQPLVSAYENGRVSPTVTTLVRLLAACELQARVQLEPLLADVDARVDALLAGEPACDATYLPNLVRTLEGHPEAHYGGLSRRPPRREGPVTWAVDGALALQCHGLSVRCAAPAIAVVWDEATRWWLEAVGAQVRNSRGDVLSVLGSGPDELRAGLSAGTFTLACMLIRVRLVEVLPSTVHLQVEWHDRPVPVVTVDEVEQSYPEHAEVLRRLRQRRAG